MRPIHYSLYMYLIISTTSLRTNVHTNLPANLTINLPANMSNFGNKIISILPPLKKILLYPNATNLNIADLR